MSSFALSGKASLTHYGQHMLARSQYSRGKSFLGAALLLRRYGGDEYVVLHLLCQAAEIMLKAFLMLSDFQKYGSKKLKKYNHDLALLVSDTLAEFQLLPLRPALLHEFRTLDWMYKNHLFRYPSPYNILVDPKTIPRDLVLRRLAATMRLAEREIARL